MSRVIPRVVLLLTVVATSGCGGDSSLFEPPTGPAPLPVTQDFTGTINQNGATTHPFSTQAGGNIIVTLSSVAPATTIGVSLGTWNGATCQIILANDRAVAGATVVGTAGGIGDFCARVYDVGSIVTPTTYALNVVHP